MLSPIFLQHMQDLYTQFTQHDAKQTHRLARYRNIEPESGLFLNMQVRMQAAQHILEIGTSTGYSTLWLANAAQSQNAKVTTLEIEVARIKQAQQYAKQLGLSTYIEFLHQDALDFLQQNKQQFDFILLDAERDAYIRYWPYLRAMLSSQSSTLVIDNVLSHAEEVRELLTIIQQDSRFICSTIDIGAGLLFVIAH